MKNFGLIGVAGYIAPRHLRAIKETGNRLVACLDKNDAVGILDNFFPGADFFTEFERFERHLEKLRRKSPQERIEYLAIASPNYLHDAHVRLALRIGAEAICEKPLVINPWNLDGLKELERELQTKVNTILQLRLHPAVQELKSKIIQGGRYRIELTYITARGRWYYYSWKGDEQKSGGIITNIGIHFFDLLLMLFGEEKNYQVFLREKERAAGFLELKNADVFWFLSLDWNDLPQDVKERGARTYRSIQINGKAFDLSAGFENLHTLSYAQILQGNGFGIEDARPAIELVYRLRHAEICKQRPADQFFQKYIWFKEGLDE